MLIVLWRNNIPCYNNFLEGIIDFPKRANLLFPLFLIRNRISGLDIISARTEITYEIHLKLFAKHFLILIFFCNGNYTYIYTVSSPSQLVVNNIFHSMGLLKLTEIDARVAKSKIGKVVFLWGFNIRFSSNIIPLC